ncbi:MAG: hypothetical protein PHE17_18265 [Thiothrix sp.]|uniref:hypothetical protein n=1 Tax=Thiothrix sp. TaxID=1032 RepID=UPI00262F3D33|nr:hypothetical protein [Thiothrix sp.]MDD5394967.1 hypothetical protein [Thiothrix sp.]
MRKMLAGCLCSLLFACAAVAGDGHDHGEEKAAAAPASPAASRLVMESTQFELVGTLEGDGLHLHLDDYASNAPVTDASVELELAGQRIKAEPEADGSYQAALAEPFPEGEYAVMATILAGETSDLLTGDLDVHAAEEMHAEPTATTSPNAGGFLLWLLGLAVVAMALVVFTLRRDRQQRKVQA